MCVAGQHKAYRAGISCQASNQGGPDDADGSWLAIPQHHHLLSEILGQHVGIEHAYLLHDGMCLPSDLCQCCKSKVI